MTAKVLLGTLLTWVGMVKGLDNGLGRTPQMGWNSWNAFHCSIDQTVIQETIKAIITSNLSTVGYVYVNMDDCWAYAREPGTNVIIPDPTTFPDGIAPLAQMAHDNGLKFGLYSDAGNFTCAGRPGSLGYETVDADTYAEWEVDYLKYDNCYSDNIPPQTRYPVMRDALNATGRPIFYSLCEWGVDDPWTWAGDVGNSWRTTNDIQDNWSSMLSNWDNNGPASDAGPGGWNDPDMLEIGNGGMTTTEYITHFSLWCIGKAPLIIGCDIRNMTQETAAILMNKEVIAINQDPLGEQCTLKVSQNSGNQNVYGAPLSNGDYAVLFLNRLASSTATVTVTWSQLGLNSATSYWVRDLWAHENLGAFKGSFTAQQIPPHGVLMARLSPVS